MTFLTVTDISKQEKGNPVVQNINFTQNAFQKIAIAGETGSGKTTLLKMIAGLVQPTTGEIRFKTKRVLGPEEHLMPGHPGIAYMSQHFELRNNYWVHEILEYANTLSVEKATALYTVCRIDYLLQRRTDQLSGGEKQRIALARLLTTSPELLLLDEPYSNLDMVHKRIMKSVVHDLGEKLGITCLMVLHEAPDILSWADTILVMKDGEIIQQGKPETVYRYPVNEYCAGLFGQYNRVSNNLAGLIASANNIRLDGRKMLIRPEHFIITSSADAFKGTVQDILFWGNYYTLDVSISGELIRVQTTGNRFSKGETVYISVLPADIVYL
ncbi:MAG: ABC transporter ATP-binding protein [Bacteroidota bacterium]